MTDPDDRQRAAMLVWAEAMDSACQAACRHRGVAPIDNTRALTVAQHAMAWEASAVLAAGVETLARACERAGLEWREIMEVAIQEGAESHRRRSPAAPSGRL